MHMCVYIYIYIHIHIHIHMYKDRGDHSITSAANSMTLKVAGEESSSQFQFDAVWTPGTQEEIFEDWEERFYTPPPPGNTL